MHALLPTQIGDDPLISVALPIISVVIAAAGIGIPVAIFAAESRKRRTADIEERKRRAIERAIDAVDRAIRAQMLYPVSRIWTSPELEISMVLSRLLLELPVSETDVATWVGRQAQLVQLEPNRKKATTTLVQISFKLASWNRGEVTTSWFTSALARDNFENDLIIPKRVRLRKAIDDTLAWAKVETLPLVLVLIARRVLKQ